MVSREQRKKRFDELERVYGITWEEQRGYIANMWCDCKYDVTSGRLTGKHEGNQMNLTFLYGMGLIELRQIVDVFTILVKTEIEVKELLEKASDVMFDMMK